MEGMIMLRKKITTKVLAPTMLALLFTVSSFIPVFASGGYTPIDPITHKEVENNDTEENANIIPFDGIGNSAYGHYNYDCDEDNFIFTCGVDTNIEFKFKPISRSSKSARFFIWIEDKLTGEVIHGDQIKEIGKDEYINFKGEAGHSYLIFIGMNGTQGENIGAHYGIIIKSI